MRARQAMRAAALAVLAAAAMGCDGEDAPTAEIVDHAPSALTPGDDALDDLSLVVHYTDADGDLGQGAVEVYDCRGGVLQRSALPAIASAEAVDEGVEIEGDLRVVVADVGPVEGGSPPAACAGDASAFCVVLVDAAGNASEPSCVSGIVIATE